jgi:hypothetical protein
VDADSTKTCLISYVSIGGTSPSLICYDSRSGTKGALVQNSYLREGDLIVRKIVDESNAKECLITYVSTEGTSPYIHCSDKAHGKQPAASSKQRAVPVTPAPTR